MKKLLAIFIIFNAYTNLFHAMDALKFLGVKPTSSKKEIEAYPPDEFMFSYYKEIETYPPDKFMFSRYLSMPTRFELQTAYQDDTTVGLLAQRFRRNIAQQDAKEAREKALLETMAEELVAESQKEKQRRQNELEKIVQELIDESRK